MKEEIIVTVKKGGEIHTEVRGVKGKQCIEITEFISALGESTTKYRTEYFQCGKTRITPPLIIGKEHKNKKEPA